MDAYVCVATVNVAFNSPLLVLFRSGINWV